jgi:DNA-binding transcriptional ArsR family regulator
MEVTTAAQHKALSHPFRQRLLFALGREPATVSGLAVRLDTRKGTVGHHLKVLADAGMVRVASTRTVRGGTEVYWERAAPRIELAGNEAGPTTALLGAVADELAAAPADPLLTLRHVRLTTAQAERLAAAAERLVAEAPDEPGEPVHGLLVALYRHPDPPATG